MARTTIFDKSRALARLNPEFTFDSPRRQSFSIPYSIISYIIESPSSPKGLLKLQQTCKYIFFKKKIIVVDSQIFSFADECFYYPRRKQRRSKPLLLVAPGVPFKSVTYYSKNKKTTFYLKTKIKFWFVKNLEIAERYNFLIFQKYVYQCNLLKLHLQVENQNVTLNELDMFLNGGKIESLFIHKTDIKDSNGGVPVTIDLILSKVPYIKEFVYENENEIYSNQTFQKLNYLKFNNEIKTFSVEMRHLADEISAKSIIEFIEKNVSIEAEFYLEFPRDTDKNYFNDLEECIDDFNDEQDRNIVVRIFKEITDLG